jgi:hypothetical protein
MRRFSAAVDLLPPNQLARGFVNRTSADLVHASSHGFSNASLASLSSPFPTTSDHGVHLPYSTTVLRIKQRKQEEEGGGQTTHNSTG